MAIKPKEKTKRAGLAPQSSKSGSVPKKGGRAAPNSGKRSTGKSSGRKTEKAVPTGPPKYRAGNLQYQHRKVLVIDAKKEAYCTPTDEGQLAKLLNGRPVIYCTTLREYHAPKDVVGRQEADQRLLEHAKELAVGQGSYLATASWPARGNLEVALEVVDPKEYKEYREQKRRVFGRHPDAAYVETAVCVYGPKVVKAPKADKD